MLKMIQLALVMAALSLSWGNAADLAVENKLVARVVIVTMFEAEGERAGERQLWEERLGLNQRLPLPAGQSDVFTDGKGILCITTAMGVSNAAASVMALGLDPRFDLSRAYWLVAGISGIDPMTVRWAVRSGRVLLSMADWLMSLTPEKSRTTGRQAMCR